MNLPLAVSVGDPAGVGPVVSLTAACALRDRCGVVLFGDRVQLRAIAADQGLRAHVEDADPDGEPHAVPGRVVLVDTGRVAEADWRAHAANAELGRHQLATLRSAAAFVRRGFGRALVTGPTSKAAIVAGGHAFTGQTEFLAQLDGRDDDAVSMLFLGPTLRVGLVTTHLSVRNVPDAVTAARAARTIGHVAEALARLYPGRLRRLAVVGLNPHAGEDGLFGREEIDVLTPVVTRLRAELLSDALELSGPAPAESVFRAAQRGDIDGVVAMYHDQATIAAKLLDWGASVNTTWGLSFVRTSVDHGVAYDAARAGSASDDGMVAAMDMALRLTDAATRA